jgi:phage tail-like protein
MMNSRPEPLSGATFRVEIEGLPDPGVIEVVFPDGRIETTANQPVVRYGSLILRRALTASSDWYDWWDRARGVAARETQSERTVRVVLVDRFHAEANSWTLPAARPTAYSISPLNALQSALLTETLELSVEGFEATFDVPRR